MLLKYTCCVSHTELKDAVRAVQENREKTRLFKLLAQKNLADMRPWAQVSPHSLWGFSGTWLQVLHIGNSSRVPEVIYTDMYCSY